MKRRDEVSTCQQKGFVISGMYLTNREMDVLACICNGYTLKNTAELLKISSRTIETYLNNVKEKSKCVSKRDVINKFNNSVSDHLIIKRQLDKILNISMSPLKRYLCYTQSCLRSTCWFCFSWNNIIAQFRR